MPLIGAMCVRTVGIHASVQFGQLSVSIDKQHSQSTPCQKDGWIHDTNNATVCMTCTNRNEGTHSEYTSITLYTLFDTPTWATLYDFQMEYLTTAVRLAPSDEELNGIAGSPHNGTM